MNESTPADVRIRHHILTTHAGTLCTTTARRGLQGHPFGSVVPYALDPSGRPVILIAGIAAHTANLKADPRGSLFIRHSGASDDPQAEWRVLVMGEWSPVKRSNPEYEALNARYIERVPAAPSYLKTHDFTYWRMHTVDAVRFIGGFGDIHWLPGESAIRDPNGAGIEAAAPGAIAHMNEDHRHNLIEMIHGQYGIEATDAEMVALDRAGFLVRAAEPAGLFHFSFDEEIADKTLRPAVIRVLHQARTRVNG